MTAPADGGLDGRTIIRFAHAFRSGGGMERILDDLDGILLARNSATIVRMHLASKSDETEQCMARGRGRLVLVPLELPDGHRQLAPDREQASPGLRTVVRNRILYQSLVWRLIGRRYVLRRPLRRRPGEVANAGPRFAAICERFKPDLCMMHFFGGSDADEIIHEARVRRIPVALENHFANERFLHAAIRRHAMVADAVAGMNGLDVPDYLQPRFVNLRDGIDLACFDPARAHAPSNRPPGPVLFLPSRIVRPKGQLDVVRAAARLTREGLNASVVFAGRVDSASFLNELKAEIQQLGLNDRVRFLGELSPEALRDWYAAATLLVFPTHHHEGLGRVIVEAQAMELPVVAYATGGVPEGIRDPETGFLVPTGDLGRLVERIGRLLRDPERRRLMGQAGRRFVMTEYSLEALARRHEAFYLNAIRAAPMPAASLG